MADLNIVGCNWIEVPAEKYFIRQIGTRGTGHHLKLQSRYVNKKRFDKPLNNYSLDVKLKSMYGHMILSLIQLKANGNVLLHYVS